MISSSFEQVRQNAIIQNKLQQISYQEWRSFLEQRA